MTPRWRRHLEKLVERERPDAVVVFTVPMAHFRGIPTALRERFSIPIAFYDGDVPMSLPEFGGMDTGFNSYHGADPSEYDLVLSNSEGGIPRLLELGARRAEALFWAADPEFFAPQPVEKEVDVFFYGYGDKFRRDWMAAMVGERAGSRPSSTSGSAGSTSRATSARPAARRHPLQRVRAGDLRRARQPQHHAAPSRDRARSSTARPFELASSGAAIVSNPHEGIERWFEPGSELVVVESAEEARRDLPRAGRRPGAGGGHGRARPRAGARRAHVRAPRAACSSS